MQRFNFKLLQKFGKAQGKQGIVLYAEYYGAQYKMLGSTKSGRILGLRPKN